MKNNSEFDEVKKALKCSLDSFQKSRYDENIKFFLEDYIKRIINKPFSKNDSESDTNNIEWCNTIIRLLIKREDTFIDILFSENHTRQNLELMYKLLDYHEFELRKTSIALEQYRERKKYLPKLKETYKKFKNSLTENIKLVFPEEQDYKRYLIGANKTLFKGIDQLINDIEKDLISNEPEKSKNFSQKQKKINEAHTVAVIKIINSYLEECFRVESKITIKKHYSLLTDIANDFYKEITNTKSILFDRETIKGFLKKS
ncbi:MAG TPA: hypothetical protein PKJ33_03040 [Alphaproteobacteria bacterium]|nr:hypothetical protein [Alphaproteobacteria bacterium]